MNDIALRDYQQQAIEAVLREPKGSKVIIALAVGLGKTFTASSLVKKYGGKVLWLSRQRQLSYQAANYFKDKSVGYEMGNLTSSGEDIIIATVQSLEKRLDKFKVDEFSLCVCDECFEEGTEILTSSGFMDFRDLTYSHKIAQLDENLVMDFVEPTKIISYPYNGEMSDILPPPKRRGGFSLKTTNVASINELTPCSPTVL